VLPGLPLMSAYHRGGRLPTGRGADYRAVMLARKAGYILSGGELSTSSRLEQYIAERKQAKP